MIRLLAFAAVLAACGGSSPPRSPAQDACDATWDPGACLAAGRYWEQAGELSRALEMFWRSCKRGWLESCRAGIAYEAQIVQLKSRSSDLVWTELKYRSEEDSFDYPFRGQACELRDEPSCLVVAATLPLDRQLPELETICTRSPALCADAAEIAQKTDSDDVALRLVQHGCAARVVDVCERGAHMQLGGIAMRELLSAACTLDRGAACYELATIGDGAEGKRALLERACKLRHAPACKDLGALLSAPDPGP